MVVEGFPGVCWLWFVGFFPNQMFHVSTVISVEGVGELCIKSDVGLCPFHSWAFWGGLFSRGSRLLSEPLLRWVHTFHNLLLTQLSGSSCVSRLLSPPW